MKNELPNDAPDGFRTMSPEQVSAAVALSEKTLAEFADDRYDWPTSDTAYNALERMVVDGVDTLIGTRITILDDDKMLDKKYLLLIPTGQFIIIPELIDMNQPLGGEPLLEEDPEIMEMMYALGNHLPDDEDWDDFLLLMEQGREFNETMRSIEAKLGASLGGKAATAIDWGSLSIDDETA